VRDIAGARRPAPLAQVAPGVSVDYLELFVVDDEGHEVRRPKKELPSH
jgi:hypothetical protein